MGSAFALIVLCTLLVPVARFVDDFFGANRDDVFFTGGICLDRLAKDLGLLVQPEKSEDFMQSMLLLGSRVSVCLERRAVSTQIDEDKASQWPSDFGPPRRRLHARWTGREGGTANVVHCDSDS